MSTEIERAVALVEKFEGWVEFDDDQVSEVILKDTEFSDTELLQLGPLHDARMIDLFQTRVSGSGLPVLKNFSRLERLYLTHCPLDDAGLAALPLLPNLKTLILDYTQISDEGLRNLKNVPGLLELNIGGTGCTDRCLQDVLRLTHLRDLGIHETPITDRGFLHLAQLKNLRRLFWSPRKISAAAFAQLESKLPGLQSLPFISF